jgi:ABC-type glycerol-3-phosphate transport system substrate-binding protein
MSDQFDCYVTQADPREAALTDVVLDLNAWMEAEGSAFQLDFDAAILDAFRYEGSLMALPLSIQPAIMVYNADRLAQHGLEAPSADWTFDEFLEWITSVTSVSGADKSYGFLLSSSSVSTSGLFYAGRGLQWLDLSGDFPVVNLNTLEMANTLSWINEMEQSGILFESPPEEDWWTTISSAVQSGQIGFWTTYAGREDDEFFDGKKSTFQKGIVPLPFTAKPNGPYDHSYSQGMYISRVSQNPQACWSWAKYLSEHAAMLAGVPARTSVAGSPAWESRVGAEKAAIYRLALANTLAENHNNLHAYLLWPVYDWLWQVNQNIKNGNDPMQEAALAQQKADTYLACMAPLDVSPLTRKQLSAQVQACAKQADPNY